jgi:hypothetical protein
MDDRCANDRAAAIQEIEKTIVEVGQMYKVSKSLITLYHL